MNRNLKKNENQLFFKLHSCILICISFSILTLPLSSLSWADTESSTDQDMEYLYEMSIEDLMNIKVTSVSKKEQKLSEAAAAIFVITQEDIRRSGVVNIPEALRMVPGIQVARIDANKYAITARGFNGRWANKLLVLMDGRNIYSHLYSGVIWEVQDTFLEDIERIEVIRGPGATLWGANAVNGVINIITKSAKDTQGTLAYAGGGTQEKRFVGIRYGGKWGNSTYYRFYTKYFDRDNLFTSSGENANDQSQMIRVGFQLETESFDQNTFAFIGEVFDGNLHDIIQVPSLYPPYSNDINEENNMRGGNAIARFTRKNSNDSSMALQFYYDYSKWTLSVADIDFGNFDIDFQHQFSWGTIQSIIWGLGYRYSFDKFENSQTTSLDPDNCDIHLFNAFLQDEITLIKDKLFFTMGSKFEHNDYTGFEWQPSARIMWTPNKIHSIWSAISRSVRTPSRGETAASLEQLVVPPNSPENPLPMPVLVSVTGNPDFESEKLIAYEVGWRYHRSDNIAFDIAGFSHYYEKLRSADAESLTMLSNAEPPHLKYQTLVNNAIEGHTYGLEIGIEWKPFDRFRLKGAYTYLYMDLYTDLSSQEAAISAAQSETENPQNQFSLLSTTNIGDNLELDLWLRYVDSLPAQNISGYTTMDVRVSFQPRKHIELSVVGQNLFDDSHPQFNSQYLETLSSEVERSIYGKITVTF